MLMPRKTDINCPQHQFERIQLNARNWQSQKSDNQKSLPAFEDQPINGVRSFLNNSKIKKKQKKN